MTDPVVEDGRPSWALRIALGLVGAGLLATWVLVWLVSSGRVPLWPREPDLPQPKPVPVAGGHTLSNPDWRRRPSGYDIARFYPERAARKQISGRAVISCQVGTDSLLKNCQVESETPSGWGFGEAAVRMADRFRMWPKMRDGKAVEGGEVRIPLVFKPPVEPEPDPGR